MVDLKRLKKIKKRKDKLKFLKNLLRITKDEEEKEKIKELLEELKLSLEDQIKEAEKDVEVVEESRPVVISSEPTIVSESGEEVKYVKPIVPGPVEALEEEVGDVQTIKRPEDQIIKYSTAPITQYIQNTEVGGEDSVTHELKDHLAQEGLIGEFYTLEQKEEIKERVGDMMGGLSEETIQKYTSDITSGDVNKYQEHLPSARTSEFIKKEKDKLLTRKYKGVNVK